jgi:hypothetical protein
MGSPVPCNQAQLHSAERVDKDVHPGFAWDRTALRNVPPYNSQRGALQSLQRRGSFGRHRSGPGCIDGTVAADHQMTFARPSHRTRAL